MSDDDNDLKRLFAEAPLVPTDDAFVARVETAIAWRRRQPALIAACAIALATLLVWATWPAAYQLTGWMRDGLLFLGPFFSSVEGHVAVVALLATGIAWTWLHERFGNAYRN
jgi:hypothetical protein